ncbi:N-acetylglucosamine-6-phosphate deacetylase [bacterium]|nr:N-acetylglucosamine-6-phosphate deacetylase [bacterium]
MIEGESFGATVDATDGHGSSDGQESVGGSVVDASDGYVIPGLLDIHFHGAMGEDLSDGDANGLHAIAAYEARRGVTAICPATMTLPTDVLMAAMANAAAFSPAADESELVGINMEGPYISPDKVGAQNPAYVRPASVPEFNHLQDAAHGLIRLVDLAPEMPGALDFIRAVSDDVRVSVAHTCTDYACACAAFEAGARHMTHLFNAMPSLHHRKPGPIAAAADRDDVTPEIIADGIHIHPSMVRLAFTLFGADRMILISDSLRCCGLGDGTYMLGGQQFTVRGPRATIEDGSLAGSVSDLMACMVNATQTMEIPLEDAVRAATVNPARAIGVDDRYGTIAAGKVASAVVLNEDLSVRHVILRGRLLR